MRLKKQQCFWPVDVWPLTPPCTRLQVLACDLVTSGVMRVSPQYKATASLGCKSKFLYKDGFVFWNQEYLSDNNWFGIIRGLCRMLMCNTTQHLVSGKEKSPPVCPSSHIFFLHQFRTEDIHILSSDWWLTSRLRCSPNTDRHIEPFFYILTTIPAPVIMVEMKWS